MSKKENVIRFTLRDKTAYLIISIFALTLYVNTLHHGFVLDDTAVIENNKFVKEGIKGIPQLFTTFYWQGYWEANAGLYRPVSLITFAVEYQLSPDNPMIHHLINILLYAITCCLLFRLLSKLFSGINPVFFLFVTLLFTAHPAHTEVIANIKSRDEILSLLFFILCCNYLYLNTGNKTRSLILSTLFFLLALLSKEGSIIFLPLILMIDFIKEKDLIALVKNRIHLISASIVWLIWHQYVIRTCGFPVIQYTRNDNSLIPATFLEQKATALGMFARYIMKLIYPYQLSYDYSFNQIPIINLFSPLALFGIVLLGALLYFGIKYLKREPLISISIGFILFPLFLTGNLFFNIGTTMADRFLFVPVIGSSLLICWCVFRLLKTDPAKNFTPGKAAAVFIPLLLLFSFRTYTRNSNWKDNSTLFASDVTTVPNSARAHYNHGTAIMGTGAENEIAAQKEFETCLSIDPSYYDAYINLGALYLRQKKYQESLSTYRKALAINQSDGKLYGNMGEAFYRSQQPDSTIIYMEKAHKFGNRIAASYNIAGSVLFSKKEYEKACKEFEQGLVVDPASADLYLNYGNALAMCNRDKEAITSLEKSYTLDPKNVQALYFIAITYNKLGDTLNANKYYNEFQRINK